MDEPPVCCVRGDKIVIAPQSCIRYFEHRCLHKWQTMLHMDVAWSLVQTCRSPVVVRSDKFETFVIQSGVSLSSVRWLCRMASTESARLAGDGISGDIIFAFCMFVFTHRAP